MGNRPINEPVLDVLPHPDPRFKGVIGRTYKDSKPDKIPITTAPEGAPNVLIVLIDDCGFGQWSTFGGQIPTPNLDRLAKKGLSYTRFHTTALCSPTRAALLTGRNHHSVGTGVITELGCGFPGYSGQIPKTTAMVSEILRQNGYSTAFFGKNHNIADWETSVSGPYDRWPCMQGFDHFYGFIGGEANQWAPALYRDSAPVELEVPKGREHDYTLNEALADEVIDYIHKQKSVTPDRPFFIYYAPGATHAPHHVPKAWIDKFKGQFSQGWDKYREEAFARQLKLGLIPADTKLTRRPPEIPAWDSLTPDRKRVAERLMETFAAFTAQTDHEVGRVLDRLDKIGQADNTLVMWQIGDNGASMEGTLNGVFNEMSSLNGSEEDTSYVVEHIDEIGGPKSYNHFPVGWAWAMNTPFQWGKQVASHFGGTRNPVVISWPRRIKDVGATRSQFHHVIDLVPTILEAAGVPEPYEVNGVPQKPIEGASMMYSFGDAKAPEQRKTQYFEMFGNRAICHDGWIAACRHGRLPWENAGSADFDDDTWELYNVDEDFSEYADLSARYPQKLSELKEIFWIEAMRYNVLPLDDRFAERADPSLRPSLIEGRSEFTYYPRAVRIPESSAPNVKNKSHAIPAFVEMRKKAATECWWRPAGSWADTPLHQGSNAGIRIQLVFAKAISSRKLAAATLGTGHDPSRVRVRWRRRRQGRHHNADRERSKSRRRRVEKTVPARYSADETFDIGMDTGTPVSDDYASLNRFTGVMEKVEITLGVSGLSEEDEKNVKAMERAAAVAAH